MTGSQFRYAYKVKWGDCDPAGLVYYPRFLALFHDAMEAWFDEALLTPYKDLTLVSRLGLPSVHVEADFKAPCQFGDDLEVWLTLSKLGASSLTLSYRIVSSTKVPAPDTEVDERVSGRTVCVLMDLDPERGTYRKAVPIPTDLRARILAFAGQ
ncbi:MAG: acyl-CoA thioesterase [Myxococcales bacterium]|nr:MAG: acyl-CoA thioesterase [Myxococcales bacterium]